MNLMGIIPTSLSRMIPVFLALVFGTKFVQTIVNNLPMWLMDGLKTAGGILPALGIAILLRYLPLSKNFAFLLIGFFLAAYLKVPVMGAAIIGLAMALIAFTMNDSKNESAVTDNDMDGDDMEDE